MVLPFVWKGETSSKMPQSKLASATTPLPIRVHAYFKTPTPWHSCCCLRTPHNSTPTLICCSRTRSGTNSHSLQVTIVAKKGKRFSHRPRTCLSANVVYYCRTALHRVWLYPQSSHSTEWPTLFKSRGKLIISTDQEFSYRVVKVYCLK